MTSNIDITKPSAPVAYTADMRANFNAAKTEIEALQNILVSDGQNGLIIQSDGNMNVGTNDQTGSTNSNVAALYSGNTDTGTTGDVYVYSGGSKAGNSGLVYVQSSDSAAETGETYIFSGNSTIAGNSGAAGVGTGDTVSGNTGENDLYTGSSSDGASGPIHLLTGNSNNGNSGNIELTTGSVLSGNGNGGNISLTPSPGAGTGNPGLVILNNLPTSPPAITGALWRDQANGNIIKAVP